MTPARAKELLPVITAFANGEPVEYHNYKGVWEPAENINFSDDAKHYRVKPQPMTRPWSKPEHVKCGALFDGGKRCHFGCTRKLPSVITCVEPGGIRVGTASGASYIQFSELDGSEHYTWPGENPEWHPCTVTEDQPQ